jgi:transposase
MYLHANAKLGLAGRLVLVRAVEEGSSLKAAAAAFKVSPATAHRWWQRWLDGGCELSALLDRSSRPHRSPRLLAVGLQERICDCRRETGWGPRLIAGATGFCQSTVWKVLRRAGLSRRPLAVREAANRYEWPCPGDLRHMDTSRYARFQRPGHRVTGDRSHPGRSWMRPETRVGYDYAHAIVDDHSRLAYVELHDDEKPLTPRAARQARDPPPDHAAVPATHQRQGRALPPDHGTRMGLRTQLPLTSTPSPATLARQLQPPATPQLNRRPATNQPRSQSRVMSCRGGVETQAVRGRPGPNSESSVFQRGIAKRALPTRR